MLPVTPSRLRSIRPPEPTRRPLRRMLAVLATLSITMGLQTGRVLAAGGPGGTPSHRLDATTMSGVPSLTRIYVIVMENHEYNSIVGNPSAPYINRLISTYGLAENYDAVTHPSEPNYLALFSGSTEGVTDDGWHSFSGANLADQLDAHGKSWRVFAQNVPLGCYTGSSASGGEDGAGTYVRKHEPAISFTDISRNSSRCSRITDFMHFGPWAANFQLIVPNLCNDMHDCSVAAGDYWLSKWVPKIITSGALANSAIFITWDEGTTSTGGGGHVATVVVSPFTKTGQKSTTWHNHYSLLRTIEDSWGLGCLNNSCGANDLRELLGG